MNKQYILKKNHDIDSLVKFKQSVGNTYYAIYYRKSESLQIVVSVSKKLGKAVVRNYNKRVLKEIIRKNMDQIPFVNMLIVVKKNSLNLTYLEKEVEIIKLIKRIKVKKWKVKKISI